MQLARAWTSHVGAERALDMRILVFALVHVHEYVQDGPNYCTRSETVEKSRKQAVYMLTILFMNVGEFVERREAAQEPPGVSFLLSAFFPIESQVVAHAIASGCTCGYMRLFDEY